ncbi:MAG TPA: hypothetical protein VF520_16550 [Thermoleophilaceae bacterium]|jgi:hypothetical protein
MVQASLRPRLRLPSLAIAALLAALLVQPPLALAQDDDCNRSANQEPTALPAPKKAKKSKKPKGKAKNAKVAKPKPITLDPVTQTQVVNFGTDRSEKSVDVVLTASTAVPRRIKGEHFELDVPQRFRRVDDKLETTVLPRPTFSEPRIFGKRRRIALTICLDGEDVKPGAYTGNVVLTGPAQVGDATVTLTVNAKNGGLFALGLVLAVLTALALLFYKAMKAKRDAAPADGPIGWGTALWRVVGDFAFWAETIVSIGAAVVAVYVVWSQDPAWGDDEFPSIVALGATALAAAGVQNLIATVRGSGA